MKALKCSIRNFRYHNIVVEQPVEVLFAFKNGNRLERFSGEELALLERALVAENGNFIEICYSDYLEVVSIFDEIRGCHVLPPKIFFDSSFRLIKEGYEQEFTGLFGFQPVGFIMAYL